MLECGQRLRFVDLHLRECVRGRHRWENACVCSCRRMFASVYDLMLEDSRDKCSGMSMSEAYTPDD